ncbi:efflux RND transporter permease subunit [Heliophilum fasciatum]|uniref:HAE1 family hydrophobic/amphiphilic exporter-1 n=1 Tax=Heliophilum fasciatum TaxID=35700 RepID=A0A4R2RW61_9FIRM|nr:efflux RND transporter permease subunit [Heliophilum fasciatum]MCW2276857.1 HAE1 family hydrophobic/amphiphilic exporter-1 [Heliophilum fasciatum]TCP68682.1 HAE1 family hydrophobic/amphiphilic exporter-1 [Heliophilum fasciatum]
MNITEFSIKRPAGISMIVLFFVVLGLYSYDRIGVELLPAMNTPYVTVQVSYPGAAAEEVEAQVIEPLEDAVSSVSKLKSISSTASQGSGSIVLEFDLTADADQATLDVTKKVDAVKGRLPEDANDPMVIKRDINAAPIMNLGISSEGMSKADTYYLAKNLIQERLARVYGVSEIQIYGGRQKEIAVEVDPQKMNVYNVALNAIVNKIKSENANKPAGKLYQKKDYDLRVLGEFSNIKEIENLAIPTGDGTTVTLKTIATVREQIQEVREMSRLNGEESVGLAVFKQSDASVVDVGAALRTEVEKLQKELPHVNIIIGNDSSDYVNKSLNNTQMSIFEGILTTTIALFFFLKDWRSMLTVLVAIPTSLISTIFIMYINDFSFNMMSLMGMALCIGILVDDSIVVLENIHRHLAMGKRADKAALEGRNEIGMAAIAITLCDVIVFLPIAFMEGMVGQFFRQFGLTIVFATLFSLFVSFTVTPMLSSQFYRRGGHEIKQGPFWQKVDQVGQFFQHLYEKTLNSALNNGKKVLAGALVLFIAAVSLIPLKVVGAEFLPQTDEGSFSVNIELPQGTPFERTDRVAKRMEALILESIPEVKFVQARVSSNSGSLSVMLTNKRERERTVWQIADQVRAWGKEQFPPGVVRVSETAASIAGLPGRGPGGGGGPGGSGGGGNVQINVMGPDPDKLQTIANEVMDLMRNTPGAKDVNTSWRTGQPEIQTVINRERVKYYGTSINDIANVLQTGVTGSTAGTFTLQGEDIDINVRFKDGDEMEISDLKKLPISVGGQNIAMSNLVDFKEGTGPRSIRRIDKQRTITLTCNLNDRPLQEFTAEVQEKIKAQNFDPLYTVKLAGQVQNMNDTFTQMISALILSLLLVYMVLVVLYESFLTPFIRMFSLPLGMIGALAILALTKNSLNLFSLMGIVMMDGLVAKNGTLLLDYALTLMGRGKSPREAIIESGKTRLRPISMTTITMVVGMLPTALAIAEGAENRVGMAWVIIGGLLTSTFFTVIIIPIIFIYIYRLKEKWDAKRALPAESTAGSPESL